MRVHKRINNIRALPGRGQPNNWCFTSNIRGSPMAAGGWIPLAPLKVDGSTSRGRSATPSRGCDRGHFPYYIQQRAHRPVRVHKRINNIRALPGRGQPNNWCFTPNIRGSPMAAGGWIPLASLKVDRSTSRGCSATPWGLQPRLLPPLCILELCLSTFVAIPGKRIGKKFLEDFFVWENE